MKGFFKIVFASLVGFVLGLLILFGFFAILVGSIANSANKSVNVKDNSVLELNLGINVPERLADDPFSKFTHSMDDLNSGIGLDKIIFGLDKARDDKKIKGILLRADYFRGGMATAEEIRNKIIDFKKSGKFVYAYGEFFTERGYYIASACDKVFLNPKGIVEFNGFAGQVMMYKGMLDKLGLEFQVFKAGKYKSAVEPFVSNTISEPNRLQISQYVNEIFGLYVKNIAISRGLDSGDLANTANGFLARNAQKAVDYKLADALKYEDEVETLLKDKLKLKEADKLSKVSFTDYTEDLSINGGEYQTEKIAVIYADGEISMGRNENGDGIGSTSLAATLRKARLDKNIKAIVLRVNSPGGSSNASDIIAREIELCKKIKPVIISFGNVAASGGYYISCLGDSIFSYRSSITGSIGVFAMMLNSSRMYKEKLGLGFETVTTGEFADMGRPDRALTANQGEFIQETVDQIYDDFIQIVAKGRHMTHNETQAIAEGHVYTGLYARQLGLVDQFGGLQRAIASASNKAKLKKYRIVLLPELKSTWEQLFGPKGAEEAKATLLRSELGDMYDLYQEVQAVRNMKGVQMRMPWNIAIN